MTTQEINSPGCIAKAKDFLKKSKTYASYEDQNLYKITETQILFHSSCRFFILLFFRETDYYAPFAKQCS